MWTGIIRNVPHCQCPETAGYETLSLSCKNKTTLWCFHVCHILLAYRYSVWSVQEKKAQQTSLQAGFMNLLASNAIKNFLNELKVAEGQKDIQHSNAQFLGMRRFHGFQLFGFKPNVYANQQGVSCEALALVLPGVGDQSSKGRLGQWRLKSAFYVNFAFVAPNAVLQSSCTLSVVYIVCFSRRSAGTHKKLILSLFDCNTQQK